MRIRALILFPCLLLACAQRIEAQVVQGTVVDRASHHPVRSAVVTVLNPDSSLRAAGVTDGTGHFLIRPDPGPFLLRVGRFGYATISSEPLEMTSSDTLNFDIQLPQRAVQLDPLEVKAIRDPTGFYERQRRGSGKYLGPDQIDALHPTFVGDLLNVTMRVRNIPTPLGPTTSMVNFGSMCQPTVYLNGVRQPAAAGEPLRLDALLSAQMVRAVEVYRDDATAPGGFHTSGGRSQCGIIVLWTYVGFGFDD